MVLERSRIILPPTGGNLGGGTTHNPGSLWDLRATHAEVHAARIVGQFSPEPLREPVRLVPLWCVPPPHRHKPSWRALGARCVPRSGRGLITRWTARVARYPPARGERGQGVLPICESGSGVGC